MKKPSPEFGIGKRDLREKMLVDLLRVVAAAGLVGYGPSAWLSIRQGLWIVLIADTLAVAYVICLALIPKIPISLAAYPRSRSESEASRTTTSNKFKIFMSDGAIMASARRVHIRTDSSSSLVSSNNRFFHKGN